jgi:MFS transporter, MCT family, aspergillic acid transporter
MERGESASQGGYPASNLNSAYSLFGRLISGYFADKVGRWNVVVIASTLSGIIELALWIPATVPSVVILFAAMIGFASGPFISLVGALPASVTPPQEVGYRIGLVFFAIALPALAVGPLGGAILKNGWLDLKVFGGMMCLAGAAIISVSRLMYTDKVIFKVF